MSCQALTLKRHTYSTGLLALKPRSVVVADLSTNPQTNPESPKNDTPSTPRANASNFERFECPSRCTSTIFASDPYSYTYSYTPISQQNQCISVPIQQVHSKILRIRCVCSGPYLSSLLGSEVVELVDERVDLAIGKGELGLKLPQGIGVLLRRLLLVQFQHPVDELHHR